MIKSFIEAPSSCLDYDLAICDGPEQAGVLNLANAAQLENTRQQRDGFGLGPWLFRYRQPTRNIFGRIGEIARIPATQSYVDKTSAEHYK